MKRRGITFADVQAVVDVAALITLIIGLGFLVRGGCR